MKPNLKLATIDDPPPRTPEREALAAAIERREAATKRLAQLSDALERLAGQSHDAHRELEVAERQQREAKRNESSILASLALGELAENPLAAAERAVSEANERLAVLRNTQAALMAEREREEKELGWSELGIDRTVRTVMQSEAADFIDQTMREAAALQAELAGKRAVLTFMQTAAYEWPDQKELSEPIRKFLAASWPDASRDPLLGHWRAAQASLAIDADAALPV